MRFQNNIISRIPVNQSHHRSPPKGTSQQADYFSDRNTFQYFSAEFKYKPWKLKQKKKTSEAQ